MDTHTIEGAIEDEGVEDSSVPQKAKTATQEDAPRRGRGRPKKEREPISEEAVLDELRLAFQAADLECPTDFGRAQADGRWHRCLTRGQTGNPRYGDGAYAVHWIDEHPVIIVCNGDLHAHRIYRQTNMTRAERKDLLEKIQRHVAELTRQTLIAADDAARRATTVWERLRPLTDVCGYLTDRHLHDTYGLRGHARCIHVPLRNEEGELRATQYIVQTRDGNFALYCTKGATLRGLFFEFPEDDETQVSPIVIGARLATVATVVEATGYHGVASLTHGNLETVTGIIKRRYPRRDLIVLSDNDDMAGKGHATALRYGAKLATCPAAIEPNHLPADLNELYCTACTAGTDDFGADIVRTIIEAASRLVGCPDPQGFQLVLEGDDAGLYAHKDDAKTGISQDVRLGPPLIVEGHVRDADGQGWGLLVSWMDPDGNTHREALSRTSMITHDRTWLSTLVSGGYQADSGYAADLLRFLETCSPARKFLFTKKTGWLDASHECFVLPNTIIGTPNGADVSDIVYSNTNITASYKQNGTLEEWKNNVSVLASGNTKLTFALCAAFAGPLLNILNVDNGGFHFTGSSTAGKTTLLLLAHSVWDSKEALGTWRATDNGKEAEAYARNDTLLCLDDINQATAKSVGFVVYMLGNGTGKARSTKHGTLRETKKFRIVFLSSGEVSIERLLTSHGESYMAGMDVRAMEIPVEKTDVKELHGFASARDLSNAIKHRTVKYYGTAGKAYVDKLLSQLKDKNSKTYKILNHDKIAIISNDIITTSGYSISETDPQIQRVAERIALVCISGMIAKELNIIDDSIDVRKSCIEVFKSWVNNRGGVSSQEEAKIIKATKEYILRYREERFCFVSEKGEVEDGIQRNSAGFKEYVNGKMQYYAFPEIIEKDAWKEMSINTVLEVLKKNNYIITSNAKGRRHYKQLKTVPLDGSRQWMYCITLQDETDTNDD